MSSMCFELSCSFFSLVFIFFFSLQVPCNVSELDFKLDPVGNLNCLSDWLTSLGLPMYINSLAEVQCDDMASMPYLEERHFQFAGISDLRHMRRLLASVEQMPR